MKEATNTANNPALPVSRAMRRAWKEYQQALDESFRAILNEEFAQHPASRARGLYMLQMLQQKAFAFYIAPVRAFPLLYSQSVFMPFEIQWGLPSPDFFYRWTFLDGAHTYRLWGNRGTTRWLDGQMQRGWWGDDFKNSHLGNFDFDDFEVESDGSFEIMASPVAHKGNWIPLDPKVPNIVMNFREIFGDWEKDRGAQMYIETLDRRPDEGIVIGEDEMVERLRGAAGLIRYYATDFVHEYTGRILDKVGTNKLWLYPVNAANDLGGNPQACYIQMVYDLRPDEALIIETEIPRNVRYWSFQLGDVWFQTIDFTYFQSSLNDRQALLDADGKCRCVLSHGDPGVPNWIDCSDLDYGVAQWRWYLADTHPVPTTRKVPLTEVRKYLPADTPAVSAELRRTQLDRRARASLGR